MKAWTVRVKKDALDMVNLMDWIGEKIDKYNRVRINDVEEFLGLPISSDYVGCYFTSFEDIEYGRSDSEHFDIVVSDIECGKQKEDMVNHPPHYQSGSGLEVINVIEAFTDGLNGIEATDTGNIIKYACRWKKKNGIQDLEKIVWYANHLIDYLKKKEGENE